MTDKFKPDTTHPQYDAMAPVWKKCRDCATGQRAIHAAGETYLPKLSGQKSDNKHGNDDYQHYLKRSVFMNATGRTIEGMTGLVFRKYPKIDLPEALKPFETDIDMGGISLYGMAQTAVKDVITEGRAGIMVDHPSVRPNDDGTAITLEQSRSLGHRPYMARYKADDILNWRYIRMNNATVLGNVFLREKDENNPDDDQIRELYLENGIYGQRIWKTVKSGIVVKSSGWQVVNEFWPTMGGKPISRIPFWFLAPEEGRGDVQDPPIEALADVNLAHYRNSADYENALHVAGQPTPYVSGLADAGIDDKGAAVTQTLHLGSNTFIQLAESGTAGFLQIGKDGLGALETAMERKESQMAALGARMLAPEKRQAEAAETAGIKRSGENSVLSTLAGSIDMSLTAALQFMAMWVGANPEEASIELNKSYLVVPMDASMLRELVSAQRSGAISFETFWRNLQQFEIAPEDQTAEDEQEKIANQTPSLSFGGEDDGQ